MLAQTKGANHSRSDWPHVSKLPIGHGHWRICFSFVSLSHSGLRSQQVLTNSSLNLVRRKPSALHCRRLFLSTPPCRDMAPAGFTGATGINGDQSRVRSRYWELHKLPMPHGGGRIRPEVKTADLWTTLDMKATQTWNIKVTSFHLYPGYYIVKQNKSYQIQFHSNGLKGSI